MSTNGFVPDAQLAPVQGSMKAIKNTATQYKRMKTKGQKANVALSVITPAGAYRDRKTDIEMHEPRYAAKYNMAADGYKLLKPIGLGEHGKGLALDIRATGLNGLSNADATEWLRANAGKYGFKQTLPTSDPNHFEHDGEGLSDAQRTRKIRALYLNHVARKNNWKNNDNVLVQSEQTSKDGTIDGAYNWLAKKFGFARGWYTGKVTTANNMSIVSGIGAKLDAEALDWFRANY